MSNPHARHITHIQAHVHTQLKEWAVILLCSYSWYVDYLPAISVDNDVRIGPTLTVDKEDCVVNENIQLLGCAGIHVQYSVNGLCI